MGRLKTRVKRGMERARSRTWRAEMARHISLEATGIKSPGQRIAGQKRKKGSKESGFGMDGAGDEDGEGGDRAGQEERNEAGAVVNGIAAFLR